MNVFYSSQGVEMLLLFIVCVIAAIVHCLELLCLVNKYRALKANHAKIDHIVFAKLVQIYKRLSRDVILTGSGCVYFCVALLCDNNAIAYFAIGIATGMPFMAAWYVSQQFPELDTALVLQYALAHDLVEVYADDTYIYGSEQDLASKQQREADALQRIESEWPDFQDMTATIHAYEQRADAESKFVYALDKIMPILLIYIHDGYTWKQGHYCRNAS